MSFLGPDSVKAAKFAAGAKAQGKQWAFLETFYASQGTENSGYVTDDFLDDIAKASGVDADKAHDVRRHAGRAGRARHRRRRRADAQRRLDPDASC